MSRLTVILPPVGVAVGPRSSQIVAVYEVTAQGSEYVCSTSYGDQTSSVAVPGTTAIGYVLPVSAEAMMVNDWGCI